MQMLVPCVSLGRVPTLSWFGPLTVSVTNGNLRKVTVTKINFCGAQHSSLNPQSSRVAPNYSGGFRPHIAADYRVFPHIAACYRIMSWGYPAPVTEERSLRKNIFGTSDLKGFKDSNIARFYAQNRISFVTSCDEKRPVATRFDDKRRETTNCTGGTPPPRTRQHPRSAVRQVLLFRLSGRVHSCSIALKKGWSLRLRAFASIENVTQR
jgi:hypothetical protein